MAPPADTPGVDEETARVRALYDAMAPRYDWLISLAERPLFGHGRDWACAQARGDVLEVAVGTGRRLPYYPPATRLIGVDLSPAMPAKAHSRADALNRPTDLRLGDAQHLDFPDATFDPVLATLTLCSIPDPEAAVAEMARVLRPGGRLVLLDHVATPNRAVRAIQRLLYALTVRFQGDHLLREPEHAVLAPGLVLVQPAPPAPSPRASTPKPPPQPSADS